MVTIQDSIPHLLRSTYENIYFVGKSPTVNAKSISDCSVSLSDTTYIYDGTAKEPAVTVNDGETVLTNGVDYSVSYTDNTDPGTATVIVTGMGNYTDTITDKFTIAKKSAETDITFESGSISTTLTVGGDRKNYCSE